MRAHVRTSGVGAAITPPAAPTIDPRRLRAEPMRDSILPANGRATRRTFLLGAMVTGLAVACSDDDDGGGDADGSSASGTESGAPAATTVEPGAVGLYTIVKRFPQRVQVPGEVRLPISLSTGEAEFVQDGPETLGAQVADLDGNPVGERVLAVRRDVEPADYYAFRPIVEEPGIYTLFVDGGPPTGASFEVADPASVEVPIPGQFLAGFETPTIGDPAGVDPICTRTPEICPFHTISLAGALNVARPVAYYVGTPAFCSTGSCGPALDSLIEVQDAYADSITFVHAEVYTDDTATAVAPAVEALDMFYEPALFVTDADGVIVERLDGLWDTTELTEVLDQVV
ncbi:MAG: TlpA family protein disulfide reductase, partial [Ilumatobacteraceae bacterium]